MTRIEALEIAKARRELRQSAVIENLFRKGPAVNDAEFGYRHGWYSVAGFSFNDDEITGQAYDHTQGGWAFL
jgi:hypothetical protein